MAACGEDFTALVDEHGEVWAFGSGGPHLGLGTDADQVLPARVFGRDLFGDVVVLVATGEKHTAAVAADGSLHTWGDGSHGKLGHGDLELRSRPTRLGKELLARSPAVQVACGLKHTVVITTAGRVWTCGWGFRGRLGHGDAESKWELTQVGIDLGGAQIVYVAAGDAHTTAVGADGSVWTWGFGKYGGLGLNDEQDRLVPTKMEGEALGGEKVVLMAMGKAHSVAVVDDGTLFVWGNGGYCQLGLGGNIIRLATAGVNAEAFGGSRVLTVACGYGHTLVVTEDGAIFSFGY